MGKYVIDENTLKEVADSIRAKTETTDDIPVNEFASRIDEIATSVELRVSIFNESSKSIRCYYVTPGTTSVKYITISKNSDESIYVSPSTIIVFRVATNTFVDPYDFEFISGSYTYAVCGVSESRRTFDVTN